MPRGIRGGPKAKEKEKEGKGLREGGKLGRQRESERE